jgi:hypothetical protein
MTREELRNERYPVEQRLAEYTEAVISLKRGDISQETFLRAKQEYDDSLREFERAVGRYLGK